MQSHGITQYEECGSTDRTRELFTKMLQERRPLMNEKKGFQNVHKMDFACKLSKSLNQ